MFTKPSHKIALLGAGCMLGLIIATTFSAIADNDPSTDEVPRMIPYQGTLEMDGRPVHATGEDAIWMRFDLYDSLDAEEPVYSQEIPVEVFGGRFTALLGPTGEGGAPIAEVIRDAAALSLGMTLLRDPGNDDDDIALSNRQRILATPYALWASTTTNLTVGGDITLEGGDIRGVENIDLTYINPQGQTLNVGGAVTLNNTAISGVSSINLGSEVVLGGGITVRGSDLRLGTNDGRDVGSNASQRALVHGTSDRLIINHNGDFEGGTHIASALYVQGNPITPNYHVSHSSQGSTVELDMTKITDMCGDADGCSVRIGMKRWDNNNQLGAASRTFLLYYGASNGHWRSSFDSEGAIGNNARQHVVNIWDTCYLTDGRYVNYSDLGDNGQGFKLLLWNGHRGANRSCELTFID